ncbi:hypothetical protein BJV78DRAFT_761238 [Lactifluus subvellereus]|nr:hypothetical protein BJV78DRAFT_761238 [Lactifluus subvellereus]
MVKKKYSEEVSTGRQKRAKAQPENRLPSPGPSRTGYQRIQPDPPLPVEDVATEEFATTERVASTEDDRTATNPRPGSPSPELLSIVAHELRFIDDDNPVILYLIHYNLRLVWDNTPAAESLVSREVFLRNASRKQASGFLDLVKKAAREKNWRDVILHDALWTELDPPPRFLPVPQQMIVPEELLQRVAELSWNASFVDQAVLTALEDHVSKQMGQVHAYARFCSIVQSSGMGKSRLLDEFSKSHTLIPINLRPEKTHGFPPPDVAVRVFLTKHDSYDPEIQQKSYPRACHFLLSLFVHTKNLIITLDAHNREDRIVKFGNSCQRSRRLSVQGRTGKIFTWTLLNKLRRT